MTFPIKCGRCNSVFKDIRSAEKHFARCKIENKYEQETNRHNKQKTQK